MPRKPSAHSIDLEQDDGSTLHVHYELTTWEERHEHGYTEHFSEVRVIWATIDGKEVEVPEDTEQRVLDAIR